MGIEQSKPNPKRPSLEDNIIEMKIQCKQLERAGKKAEKEEANYKKKAKEALKKNNEEGAKMFLMTAASKRNEALTCQRTALKMEYMCGQIKSMKNNETFINSFGALTEVATKQMGNFNFQTMANQMDLFNKNMDQMMINNKMVGEIMNTQEIGTDAVVDEMKNALHMEIAMEEKNKLMEQEKVIYQKHKAEGDKFINELKDL